jgi:hypothetical protein
MLKVNRMNKPEANDKIKEKEEQLDEMIKNIVDRLNDIDLKIEKELDEIKSISKEAKISSKANLLVALCLVTLPLAVSFSYEFYQNTSILSLLLTIFMSAYSIVTFLLYIQESRKLK